MAGQLASGSKGAGGCTVTETKIIRASDNEKKGGFHCATFLENSTIAAS
jgi:hypothetical protein